jgi:hypothetical protein
MSNEESPIQNKLSKEELLACGGTRGFSNSKVR